MKPPSFKTESELCAAFIVAANRNGWRTHPETHGFDIYMVIDGVGDFGIEAKLKLNMKVISQALPSWEQSGGMSGPDFRGVLVPNDQRGFQDILHRLGLIIFDTDQYRHRDFSDDLRWWPRQRLTEPKYQSDSVAGSPCPIQLTDWKIKALRLIARVQIRGFVTREDFKDLHLDPRRWLHAFNGWLVTGAGDGKFTRGEKLRFDFDHPSAFSKILSEEREVLRCQPGNEVTTKKRSASKLRR